MSTLRAVPIKSLVWLLRQCICHSIAQGDRLALSQTLSICLQGYLGPVGLSESELARPRSLTLSS